MPTARQCGRIFRALQRVLWTTFQRSPSRWSSFCSVVLKCAAKAWKRLNILSPNLGIWSFVRIPDNVFWNQFKVVSVRLVGLVILMLKSEDWRDRIDRAFCDGCRKLWHDMAHGDKHHHFEHLAVLVWCYYFLVAWMEIYWILRGSALLHAVACYSQVCALLAKEANDLLGEADLSCSISDETPSKDMQLSSLSFYVAAKGILLRRKNLWKSQGKSLASCGKWYGRSLFATCRTLPSTIQFSWKPNWYWLTCFSNSSDNPRISGIVAWSLWTRKSCLWLLDCQKFAWKALAQMHRQARIMTYSNVWQRSKISHQIFA